MDVVEVGVYGAIGAFLEQPPLVVEAESLEKPSAHWQRGGPAATGKPRIVAGAGPGEIAAGLI